MEGVPKQEQAPEKRYDRETSFGEAEKELDKLLSDISVPEGLDVDLNEAYRIESLHKSLDSVETKNTHRFVATLLEDARSLKSMDLSPKKREELYKFLNQDT